jgi:hypothetical protein
VTSDKGTASSSKESPTRAKAMTSSVHATLRSCQFLKKTVNQIRSDKRHFLAPSQQHSELEIFYYRGITGEILEIFWVTVHINYSVMCSVEFSLPSVVYHNRGCHRAGNGEFFFHSESKFTDGLEFMTIYRRHSG